MNRSLFIICLFALIVTIYSCSNKHGEGIITYTVSYELPDSLKQYAEFLPKTATVYFKGDSAVSIQPTTQESTTIIINKKTGFMRALLKSADKKFVVDYDKAAQAEEVASLPSYVYIKTTETKTIAGYTAIKYTLKDKAANENAEAWFTKDVSIIPNPLTTMLDTAYGAPLAFTIKQNGLVVSTTVASIKFDDVPNGVFSTPKGYEFLTPEQFKMMNSGQ